MKNKVWAWRSLNAKYRLIPLSFLGITKPSMMGGLCDIIVVLKNQSVTICIFLLSMTSCPDDEVNLAVSI